MNGAVERRPLPNMGLVGFLCAAAMLFAVSTLSAPAPPHRIHSADLARSALKRR